MHVETIKQVIKILEQGPETNRELQACILGYVLGLEAPIELNHTVDDKIEWNSFFRDIPGEINEHFMLNLQLVKDVADLTLLYRQAVMNASDNIEELATSFLNITGAAFGLFGNQGTIKAIRTALNETVDRKRAEIMGIINERRAATIR